MGKVYDALRKAEAERIQRPPPVPAPAFDRGHGGAGARASGGGRLSELLGLLRRSPARGASEGASSINKRRIALLHPDSFVAEQFRTLRARLDSLAAERPIRTIAITSALAGEGKTMAAVNLAIVSAMAVGRRVLLVDCDLRHPGIHGSLGLRPEAGLAEILTGTASAGQAICRVEGCALDVLPVRATPANPSELLASEPMQALLEELARSYDQVILDAPPTLALPDAKTLSERVDGVVFVVRADQTPDDAVDAALDVLDRRRLLGLVLNGAEIDAERYAY